MELTRAGNEISCWALICCLEPIAMDELDTDLEIVYHLGTRRLYLLARAVGRGAGIKVP